MTIQAASFTDQPTSESLVPEGYDAPVNLTAASAVIPGVIVVDVSASMQAALGLAQQATDGMIGDMRLEPLVAEMAHMAIVTFAGDASVDLPFSQIANPAVLLPELSIRGGGTNYEAALMTALEVLKDGLPELAMSSDNGKRVVNRPTIYFISDGMPNVGGDWRAAAAALREQRWAPNMFAFGFGDAHRATMQEIADEGCAYFAADGQTPQAMLGQIMRIILRSMVSVSQAVAGGQATALAPDPSQDPATSGIVRLDPINP